MTAGHDPRVAIVTGAGSGIGAAVASRLADDGWHTVLTGRRRAPLEQVAGAGAVVVPGDVRDADHLEALLAVATEQWGRLDGLVLNAGVTVAASVGETSDADWERVLETNLTAPFKLARAALPHLMEARGAIVGVGSIAAEVCGPEIAAYGVAKAGLVRLIRSIAVDYGGSGVRANVVNPGWTRSEMADAELGELVGQLGPDLDSVYRAITRYVPSGRAGDSAEIADAIVWLLGTESTYVNGSVVTVDGGTSIVDAGMLGFADDAGDEGK